MFFRNTLAAISTAAIATGTAASGALAAGLGQPEPWQMNLQQSATVVMDNIHSLHNGLLILITVIVLFVFALLAIVLIKFNATANPEPSKTTHNTAIEVAWTVIPILILIAIAIPSFRLLYLQREIPAADMTIKATGSQWYWTYDYPDNGNINFDANIKQDDELKPGEPRLLATDSAVVVPVNKVVKVIVTAEPDGVIHAWAVPSFGVKIDAIPGRLNELWFKANKTGTFYGQCSELCGKGHAYMPIQVQVVSEDDFKVWAEKAKTAGVDAAARVLAARISARKMLAASTPAAN